MPLTSTQLEHLADLALQAAERAGTFVQSKVGKHRETRTKKGGSTLASQVVTEVDLESERLILETLADSLNQFSLGMLTEESADDFSRHDKDYFWCIDPIDGTLPFIEGIPGYSMSIALVSREGTPWIGVVHDPVEKVSFRSIKGRGAYQGGTRVNGPGIAKGTALIWFMDRSTKALPDFSTLVEEVEKMAVENGYSEIKIVDHAGGALNGCWVADRAPAIYFKLPKADKGGGSSWDFAASACFLAEWGGHPTDIHGQPLNLNQRETTFMNEKGILYASHQDLSTAVQRLYQRRVNSSQGSNH